MMSEPGDAKYLAAATAASTLNWDTLHLHLHWRVSLSGRALCVGGRWEQRQERVRMGEDAAWRNRRDGRRRRTRTKGSLRCGWLSAPGTKMSLKYLINVTHLHDRDQVRVECLHICTRPELVRHALSIDTFESTTNMGGGLRSGSGSGGEKKT